MNLMCFSAGLLLLQTAPAAQLWVDGKAAEGGDGSQTRPFRRLQAAAQIAVAGDTVHVLPGTYRERVMPAQGGKAGKPIKYISETLHGAVIKGSEAWLPAWRAESGGLYSGEIANELFTDTQYVDGGNPYRIAYYYEQQRDLRPPHPFTNVNWTLGQVFLDDRPLTETSSRAELVGKPNAWWFEAASNRILVNTGGSKPDGRNWEITTRRGVFRPLRKGLGYLDLHGFVFAHCANQFPGAFWSKPPNAESGMVGTRSGHHWLISSNIFRHAKSIGLAFGNGGTATTTGRPYDNEVPAQAEPPLGTIGFHRIQDNLFLGQGAVGAMGFQHTGVEFRRNVFTQNNLLLNTAHETGGIKTHAASQMLIADNWFVDNECMGAWLDNTWKSCRLTRNVFAGNRGKALFFEMDNNQAATASLVDHNIFLPGRSELAVGSTEDTAKQPWRPWTVSVYGHDADGVRLTHNLFASEGYGLYFRKLTDRKGGAARIRATGNLFAGGEMTAVCLPVENPPLVEGNCFEANVYPPGVRVFAATGWSLASGGVHKLSVEKLHQQIHDPAPLAFGDPAKPPAGYYLNLDQWRSVMGFDHASRSAAITYTFEANTGTLNLDLPAEVLQVAAPAEAGLDSDFFGQPVSASATVGPFATLKSGKQKLPLPVPAPWRWR